MRFKALLWTAIIFVCIASLRFLAYQQWFLRQKADTTDILPEDDGNFDMYTDSKYWHQRCPHKVFIGDAYDGWMICEPDDVKELSGALVYSLGIDPGVNDGRGDIEWEKSMARTYHTLHHVWDSMLNVTNGASRYGLRMHTYDIDVLSVDRNPVHNIASDVGIASYDKTNYRTMGAMLSSLGHKSLAILKVELSSRKRNKGRELELIDLWDRLAYFIPADQVYVQFHHEEHGSQEALTHAVQQMHALGFRVFHRNERAFSFIRV